MIKKAHRHGTVFLVLMYKNIDKKYLFERLVYTPPDL